MKSSEQMPTTRSSTEVRGDQTIQDGKILFEATRKHCVFQAGPGWRFTVQRIGFALFIQWEHPHEGEGGVEIPEEQAAQFADWLTTDGDGANTPAKIAHVVATAEPGSRNKKLIEVHGRCKEYLKAHPGATWKEMHLKVPNHYANLYSFSNAMRYRVNHGRKSKQTSEAAGQ